MALHLAAMRQLVEKIATTWYSRGKYYMSAAWHNTGGSHMAKHTWQPHGKIHVAATRHNTRGSPMAKYTWQSRGITHMAKYTWQSRGITHVAVTWHTRGVPWQKN